MLDINIKSLPYEKGIQIKQAAIKKLFADLKCFCKEESFDFTEFEADVLPIHLQVKSKDDYFKDPLDFNEELVPPDEEFARFLKAREYTDTKQSHDEKADLLYDKITANEDDSFEFLNSHFAQIAALADESTQPLKRTNKFDLSLYKITPSMPTNYRNRVELSIWRDDNGLFYAMHENKKKQIINELTLASKPIQSLMPRLLCLINEDEILSKKLFAVEFLSTKSELNVTLIYHKNVEDYAPYFADFASKNKLNLIIRSRKKKLVFGKDELKQSLNINNKTFDYLCTNDSFIQPNTAINEAMISYVDDILQNEKCKDLLELYCGFGNFTIPLARHFKSVLATEISKENIRLAKINSKLNEILNISFIRLNASEARLAICKQREFYRLKDLNLDDFSFSHILIDPPRAGLGKEICEFVQIFSNIIYVSCNPLSLKQDLAILSSTHEVLFFKGFDQFPFTPHLENIVYLRKKNANNQC